MINEHVEKDQIESVNDLLPSFTKEIEEGNGNELVIRLREHGLPIVEEYQHGIKLGEGMYTHEAVARAIFHSNENGGFATPLLPRGTLHYSKDDAGLRSYIFFEVQPHNRRVYYHEAVIEDIPFPRLIFGFALITKGEKHEIAKVMVGALEHQSITNEDAEVYFYPYTNVDSNFDICWGGQRLPSIERVSQLTTIPELFFNSPNSDCYYSTSNVSNLTYRDLVEQVKGTEFPDHYLRKTGMTVSDWIIQLTPGL